MVANQHYSRIDTLELKALVYHKIGHQRADKYFDHLKQLFSSKISKNEFDKFCIQTIGREHISLHNRLIRSIVKNACLAKVPPLKVRRVEESLNVKVANVSQRNCLQSLYGESFPPSPRKGRSHVNRDRKFRDRPSPLGPNGKTQSATSKAQRSCFLMVADLLLKLHLWKMGKRLNRWLEALVSKAGALLQLLLVFP
ncbi:hypothetical protein CsSME_00009725 [Camellia sinensis var. sinensis]